MIRAPGISLAADSRSLKGAHGGMAAHAPASMFRILTRLKTAMHIVKSQSTLSRPRILAFLIRPTVFAQPKISSTRLRFRWLAAYPSCRVVLPSTDLPPFLSAMCGVILPRAIVDRTHLSGARHAIDVHVEHAQIDADRHARPTRRRRDVFNVGHHPVGW